MGSALAMLRRAAPSQPDATGDSAATNDQSAASPTSNRTAFLLLLTCAALINSDQNLLSPNMSACADDFGFTKQEKDEKLGGKLAAGLFLAGAPAAVAVGVAADGAMRRVDLLLLVLLIGSIGCLGSALASSFGQLFAARALTGVSLGGGLPVTFSLMGDMYDPSERAVQSGRLGVAMGAGQMLGQGLAGALGPAWGWRAPFFLCSGAMLLLAAAIAALMREPPRDRLMHTGAPSPPAGGRRAAAAARANSEELASLCAGVPGCADSASASASASASTSASSSAAAAASAYASRSVAGWAALFRTPTVWLLLLQGVPGCVPWGVISAFLPDFLHVEQEHSTPRHTTPHHTAPRRTTPHHTAPHHTTPHHAAHHTTPHHTTPRGRAHTALHTCRPHNGAAHAMHRARAPCHALLTGACVGAQAWSVHEATLIMLGFSLGGVSGQLAGGQAGRPSRAHTVMRHAHTMHHAHHAPCTMHHAPGQAGQLLYNRSPRLPALLMLVAGAAGVLPLWLLIRAPPHAWSLW